MPTRKRNRLTSPEGSIEILFLLFYSREELSKAEIEATLEKRGAKVSKYNVASFLEWGMNQDPPLIIQTLRPGWPKYSVDRQTIKAHLKRYGAPLPAGDSLSEAASGASEAA